jgi:hypothetical protein
MLSSTNRKEKMFNVRKIYMKLTPLQLKSEKPRHKVMDSHLDEMVQHSPIYQEQVRQLKRMRENHQLEKSRLLEQIEAETEALGKLAEDHKRLEREKNNYELKIQQLQSQYDELYQRRLEREQRMFRGAFQNGYSFEYLRHVLMSIRYDGELSEEINVDDMTYEELMQLEEQIGRVNRGLPEEAIGQLPQEDARTEFQVDICPICREDFAKGEKCTRLPCKHVFHSDCIARWLRTEKLCVICKLEVK